MVVPDVRVGKEVDHSNVASVDIRIGHDGAVPGRCITLDEQKHVGIKQKCTLKINDSEPRRPRARDLACFVLRSATSRILLNTGHRSPTPHCTAVPLAVGVVSLVRRVLPVW